MKKIVLIASLLITFFLGYGFNELTHRTVSGPRVTGIGGIFFKSQNPTALKAWYEKNLGVRMAASGINFEWHQGIDSTKKGFTLWVPFKETTKYFQPSEKQFMINYRVEQLDALLTKLKASGILPTDSVERVSYGKFVHIMDPEGNKIELWEPNDVEYARLSTITTK